MAVQPSLCGTRSETPKTGFLTTRLILFLADAYHILRDKREADATCPTKTQKMNDLPKIKLNCIKPGEYATCAPCPIGFYKNKKAAKKECAKCGCNMGTPKEGATKCIKLCKAGEKLLEDILTAEPVCVNCEKGTYQPFPSLNATCVPCPKNWVTANEGRKNKSDCFLNCSAGWQPNAEMTNCIRCPEGHYKSKAGRHLCQVCPKNRTTLEDGALMRKECIVRCEFGKQYNNFSGTCEDCERGMFKPENSSRVRCRPCPDYLVPNKDRGATKCIAPPCSCATCGAETQVAPPDPPTTTYPELTCPNCPDCPDCPTCPLKPCPVCKTCPKVTCPTSPTTKCPEVTCPTATPCPQVTTPTPTTYPEVKCPTTTTCPTCPTRPETTPCPEVICPTCLTKTEPTTCPQVTCPTCPTKPEPTLCPKVTCPTCPTKSEPTPCPQVTCPSCPTKSEPTPCPQVTCPTCPTKSEPTPCPQVTCPTCPTKSEPTLCPQVTCPTCPTKPEPTPCPHVTCPTCPTKSEPTPCPQVTCPTPKEPPTTMEITEKITDGIPCINDLTLSYSGTISITRSGITCQKWSEQYPHEHPFTQDSMFPADSDVSGANNYCRDPDGEGMPWCYTTLPTKRWEYCGILICNRDCWHGGISRHYHGTRSTTKSGLTCQHWSDQSPHEHSNNAADRFPLDESVSAAQNYCRDPDREGAPWCYTTTSDVRWEFCDINLC